MGFNITGDPAADKVLDESPFALLVGMALDQQVPMERAFAGPAKILDRFGTLDAAAIAAAPREEFAKICAEPPAVHRFPGAMAGRIQELAAVVVDTYGGDAASLWEGVASGAELLDRLQQLPSFGKQKAQIFVAFLAKQFGVRPAGWELVAGDYALDGYRSVADVVDHDALLKVREYKQQKKAAAKATKPGKSARS